MINKKTLFIILLTLIVSSPFIISAAVTGDAPTIAKNITTLVVNVGTAIVVIGWVIAGILYLFAQGAPDRLGTAKKAMIAAIIGTVLIVIASAGYPVIKGIIESALNTGV